MPNVIRINSPYLQSGSPDTLNLALTNLSDLYSAGELGSSFDYNDKTYCLVISDPTANGSSATGSPLANQVAYWKSKTNRTVTNDIATCLTPAAPASCVAGIYRVGIPSGTNGAAGNYIAVLTAGNGIPVVAGAVAVGAVMAGVTAGVNAIVTLTGINSALGVARTAGNPALVDVNVQNLP